MANRVRSRVIFFDYYFITKEHGVGSILSAIMPVKLSRPMPGVVIYRSNGKETMFVCLFANTETEQFLDNVACVRI